MTKRVSRLANRIEDTMQPRGKISLACALKCLDERYQFQEAESVAAHVEWALASIVVRDAMTDFEKLQFVLAHQEKVVEQMSGRKPSGRPLLMWPDGKIRIEFLGTFSSVADAYDRVSGLLLKASKDESSIH